MVHFRALGICKGTNCRMSKGTNCRMSKPNHPFGPMYKGHPREKKRNKWFYESITSIYCVSSTPKLYT